MKNKLKLLHVIPYLNPKMGGPVEVIKNMVNELADLGYQVEVISTNYLEEGIIEKDLKAEVRIFKNWMQKFNFFVSPSMINWLKSNVNSYDVIHLHDFRTFQNIIVHMFAKKFDIPYVLSPHGTLPHNRKFKIIKWIYDVLWGNNILKDSNHLFAVSPTEVDQMVELGIHGEKISLIYNGINVDEFKDLPEKGEFKKKLGIEDSAKIILGVGRLHEIKGFDVVIKSFKHVFDRTGSVYLVIVGPDEGELDKLQALVENLGLQNVVFFPGGKYGVEKIEAYNDAAVFVHQSWYDIFGLVMFEALMCNTPLVVSNSTGAGKIISSIGAGYVNEYGNEKELAKLILLALDNEKKNIEMIGLGKDFIKKRLDWANIAMVVRDVYETI